MSTTRELEICAELIEKAGGWTSLDTSKAAQINELAQRLAGQEAGTEPTMTYRTLSEMEGFTGTLEVFDLFSYRTWRKITVNSIEAGTKKDVLMDADIYVDDDEKYADYFRRDTLVRLPVSA